MQPIDPATLNNLPTLIGSDRFAPYLTICGGNAAEAIRLYSWNVEASTALLGAYAALEVAIRNSMHDQLTTTFGRPDWWEYAPLSVEHRSAVQRAISYLSSKRGASWTFGHVIAEMKPSFWEGLLANRYHASLWEIGLSAAFPMTNERRGGIRERMERLRLVRNRAAHHEPVFARDLLIDHQYMCDLAGYVSADLRIWVASHSRLPAVIAGRVDTISWVRVTRF